MQSQIDALKNKALDSDLRRMAILRMNCLSNVIQKLCRSQNDDSGSSNPEHSAKRRLNTAEIIYKARREHI